MNKDRTVVRVPYRLHQGVAPEHDLWGEVHEALREQGRAVRLGGLRRLLRSEDSLDPRYDLAVFEVDTWELEESEFGLPGPTLERWSVRVDVTQHHRILVDALSEDEARALAWRMVAEGSSDPQDGEVDVLYATKVPAPIEEAKAS